jgi:hypothetical protein
VRRRAAAEVVALHHALKPLAPADADHVHAIAVVEHGIHEHLIARLRRLGPFRQLHLTPHARRRYAGLRIVPHERLPDSRRPILDQPELHGLITVSLGALRLHDNARARLDHGARRDGAVLREQLRHADLLAENSRKHSCQLSAVSSQLCSAIAVFAADS